MIDEDLKKLISYGDYALIKEIYDERHTLGSDPDYKTVSEKYVSLVIQGLRTTQREGTAADEILMIAKRYLENKRDYRSEMLIV